MNGNGSSVDLAVMHTCNNDSHFIPQDKYDEITKLIPIVVVNAIILRPGSLSGQVLLLKRNNTPLKGHWGLPGGGIRKGESIFTALKREVKEETGLEIEKTRLVSIASDVYKEKHTVEINFLVESFEGEVKIDDESSAWGWFDRSDPTLHPAVRQILMDTVHTSWFPGILFFEEKETTPCRTQE